MVTTTKNTGLLPREQDNMKKTEEQRMREKEELIPLWQLVDSDLKFLMLQQWKTTNYALIIYAALIALFIKAPNLLSISYIIYVVIIIGLIVCYIARIFLYNLEVSIKVSRDRLNRIYKQSSHFTKTVWDHNSNEKKHSYTLFFQCSIVMGFLFFCLVILILNSLQIITK